MVNEKAERTGRRKEEKKKGDGRKLEPRKNRMKVRQTLRDVTRSGGSLSDMLDELEDVDFDDNNGRIRI